MSFYSTCEGEIRYPDKDVFDEVVDMLRRGVWIKDNYFVDEMGERICGEDAPPNVDVDKQTITIPYAHYRNISRVEFFKPGVTGHLIGTSTDGCFEGWFIEDGVEETFDLTQWAADNLEGGDAVPPPQDDNENYCEWQALVEQAFNTDFTS